MPPGTNERPFPGMPDQAEGKGRFSFNDPSPYAGRPHRDAQPTPRPNPPPRPGPSSPRATHAAPLVLTQAVVQHGVRAESAGMGGVPHGGAFRARAPLRAVVG